MIQILTFRMVIDKETPGTIRFMEVTEKGKNPLIGKLYIPKSTLSRMGNPVELNLTIEGIRESPDEDSAK